MKNLIVFFLFFFVLTGIANAEIQEYVYNGNLGQVTRQSVTTLPFNESLNIEVNFASISNSKLNYALMFTFAPIDENAAGLPMIYLAPPALVGYSTPSTLADYRITSFSKALSSKRLLLNDGYHVDGDSIKYAGKLKYTPAKTWLKYDTNWPDVSKKIKDYKNIEYWNTNTQFTEKLFDLMEKNSGIDFYLLWFKTDVDSVEMKNIQRFILSIPPDTTAEWKTILEQNGYIK